MLFNQAPYRLVSLPLLSSFLFRGFRDGRLLMSVWLASERAKFVLEIEIRMRQVWGPPFKDLKTFLKR